MHTIEADGGNFVHGQRFVFLVVAEVDVQLDEQMVEGDVYPTIAVDGCPIAAGSVFGRTQQVAGFQVGFRALGGLDSEALGDVGGISRDIHSIIVGSSPQQFVAVRRRIEVVLTLRHGDVGVIRITIPRDSQVEGLRQVVATVAGTGSSRLNACRYSDRRILFRCLRHLIIVRTARNQCCEYCHSKNLNLSHCLLLLKLG